MEFLMMVPVMLAIGLSAFNAGQWTKQYPDEEEMMKRLIRARAERYRSKWDAEEIEREVEEKALAMARKA